MRCLPSFGALLTAACRSALQLQAEAHVSELSLPQEEQGSTRVFSVALNTCEGPSCNDDGRQASWDGEDRSARSSTGWQAACRCTDQPGPGSEETFR